MVKSTSEALSARVRELLDDRAITTQVREALTMARLDHMADERGLHAVELVALQGGARLKPVAVPTAWRHAAEHLRRAQEAERLARWAEAMQDGETASVRLREAARALRKAAEGMERAAEIVKR